MIIPIFKRVSSNSKDISFQEFINCLEIIAILYYDEKLVFYEKRAKAKEEKAKLREELAKRKIKIKINQKLKETKYEN